MQEITKKVGKEDQRQAPSEHDMAGSCADWVEWHIKQNAYAGIPSGLSSITNKDCPEISNIIDQ